MSLRQWITGSALVLLLGGALVGVRLNRPVDANAEPAAATAKKGKDTRPPQRMVDQRSLLTARRLAPLASTEEERGLARQAERLASHEIRLAFSEAVRQALDNPAPLTPEATELKRTRDQIAATLEASQALGQRLEKQLEKATQATRTGLEDQLALAKAQQALYADELEAAQENLERVGGDPQARVRRLKEAQEAADRDSKSASVETDSTLLSSNSALGRLRFWNRLRSKRNQLDAAQQEALNRVQRLTNRMDTLAKNLESTKEAREATKQWAKDLTQAKPSGASSAETESAAWEMRRISAEQSRLATFAKRIQDHRGLADIYGQWSVVAQTQLRAATRALMMSLVALFAVCLGGFLLNRLVERLFFSKDVQLRKPSATHAVIRFIILFICLAASLFLVLGVPAQATTILGLAGAGLTVALKDFIVAFFGWFILMGRNGIRVGDWVEIKGVGGEVVEVGPLRTVLLETGNWNDAGHPTGRRVAFVNSFAMEGHFFNFSTSGQWMWDELNVQLPAGQNPYALLQGIQSLVNEQTQKNVSEAEAEWRRTTRRYRVKSFSATPGVQLVATSQGLEVRARYITRAYERFDTRQKLNDAVVDLLHRKQPE